MDGATAASSYRAHFTEVARALDTRLPEIVREMRDLLSESIPDLQADPTMRDMLQASIEGNLSTMCHIIANDISPVNLQPTTGAVEYAARLGQRGVPVSALSRAYYLGQSLFLRRGIDTIEQLPVPDDVRIVLVRGVADVVHRYIDWILQYVSEVHERERRRWWSIRSIAHSATVVRVLRGDDLPSDEFRAETGYALGQTHLALIVWDDAADDAHDQQRIDGTLRRIASALGSPTAPLVMAFDPQTAWAWIAVPRGAGVDAPSSDVRAVVAAAVSSANGDGRVRLAIGEPREGIDGFRASHQQARAAQTVATLSAPHRDATVVSIRDTGVSMLALHTHDLQATRRWVRSVLGPFAGGGEAEAALRATVAAYYRNGESYLGAAQELGLHRNTVRLRVTRFMDAAKATPDALETALALRLYESFGEPD